MVISPRLVMALAAAVVLAAGSVPAAEIHDAARSGDSSKVKALVEKDPGLASARNPNGQTPLFDAVMGRHPEIAEYLISKGADVNAENNFHMTVLHVACRGGFPLEIIRLLVEKGADVNAAAKYMGRPLDLANESGDTAILQYLTSKGAQFTPLDFDTFPLADRVHRIAYPWGMRNNLVVSAGPDGILVVDTGFNKRALDAIRKTIGGFAKGDIKYVVNTHSNWDHVAGNALAPSEAAVIGYRSLDSGDLKDVAARTEKPLSGPSGRTLPAPYIMRFNGEEIAFIPYPGLHSQDDILIHFTTSGVVCMGDLLLSQSCPAIDNVAGYMELLDKVIDVFPAATRFVSGHGRDLTLEELKRYRDALAEMIGMVKKNHAAGKTADDMIRADILKAYKPDYSQLDWLGPDTWIVSVVRSLQSGSLK